MEESYSSDGMLDTYLYESFQLLEQLETIVLLDSNEEFLDEESVHEIFRIVHTIKGTSGIMMYDNIAIAAHKLEDIFYYLRETYREDISTKDLMEYIFMVSDFIEGELDKIKEARNPDGNPDNIIKSIDELLLNWKDKIRERGGELPPENLYVEPRQYYIAPAEERADNLPSVIDLGEEPEPNPGDYVIKNGKVAKENVVGISERKLDKLARLVENLMEAEKNVPEETNWNEFREKLMEITDELETTVTQMRKTSLAATFRRMNRIVYDVSRKLHKEIEFIVSGEKLEVERKIIACISDSLIHLVRNAADHGIEEKAERLRSGKEERGKITVEAKIDGDTLYIYVRDDGRGIDKQKVFYKADKQGLIDMNKNISEYTDKEIYHFITLPGFSTKEKVTEYSGRGVGMDTVVKELGKIDGKLEINSVPGEGTEMRMVIPLN